MKVIASGANTALGFVQMLPDRCHLSTKEQLLEQMYMALGNHLLEQDHFHGQDVLGTYNLILSLATGCAVAGLCPLPGTDLYPGFLIGGLWHRVLQFLRFSIIGAREGIITTPPAYEGTNLAMGDSLL